MQRLEVLPVTQSANSVLIVGFAAFAAILVRRESVIEAYRPTTNIVLSHVAVVLLDAIVCCLRDWDAERPTMRKA